MEKNMDVLFAVLVETEEEACIVTNQLTVPRTGRPCSRGDVR